MAIVMRFTGITSLRLTPANSDYTCEIHEATLFFKDGFMYWADCNGIENKIDSYDGTWVCAEKIQWCIADDKIGNNVIFNAKF